MCAFCVAALQILNYAKWSLQLLNMVFRTRNARIIRKDLPPSVTILTQSNGIIIFPFVCLIPFTENADGITKFTEPCGHPHSVSSPCAKGALCEKVSKKEKLNLLCVETISSFSCISCSKKKNPLILRILRELLNIVSFVFEKKNHRSTAHVLPDDRSCFPSRPLVNYKKVYTFFAFGVHLF